MATPTASRDLEFLGRGWAYPLDLAPGSDIASAAGPDDVRQALHIILGTAPGERTMRPDFGSGLRDLMFEPANATTRALVLHRVETALVQWEPRIDVISVRVSAEDAPRTTLLVQIEYRVRATNTFYNLVYPFDLAERSPT